MKHTLTLLAGLLLVAAATFTAHASDITTFGMGANQFTIDFVPITNPGGIANPADTTGAPNPAGSVGYDYVIGKYEISEEIIEKVNAGAGLGITKDTRGPNQPATSISWTEAAIFVNWLNTSQGFQAAYDFDAMGNFQLWASAEAWQLDGENLFRHKDAHYWLPSVDEWYKAAYYDPGAGVYYDYPTGSDSVPDGIDFAGDPNFDAVYADPYRQNGPNDVNNTGLFSPYGTMGQGGNVGELRETAYDLVNDVAGEDRVIGRGSFLSLGPATLNANLLGGPSAFAFEGGNDGFRVAGLPSSVPEGGVGPLAAVTLIGLCVLKRRRAVAASH